jgi:hypothetical protein
MRWEKLICVACGKMASPKQTRCKHCRKAIVKILHGSRFELQETLSWDPVCVSYRAFDNATHRRVLVRLLRHEATTFKERRVLNEARFLRKHAGDGPFPAFVYAGRAHGTKATFLVYEYVEGTPLPKAVQGKRTVDVIDTFFSCLIAVGAVHDVGRVYCDAKPEHFLVTSDGGVKLIDFCSVRESGLSSLGMGTPGYRAPEQYKKSEPVSPATDVFALGACLYSLLTGRHAYPAKKPSSLFTPGYMPPAPSTMNQALSPRLDKLIMRAIERDPKERFSDAKEFREALHEEFMGTTDVDGLGIPFSPFQEAMANACRFITKALGSVVKTFLKCAKHLVKGTCSCVSRGFVRLPRPVQIGAVIAAILAAVGIPGITWFLDAECEYQLLSRHTSAVYVDGQYVAEAPSPLVFRIGPGLHTFRFETTESAGIEKRQWLWPDSSYLIASNPGTKALTVTKRNR